MIIVERLREIVEGLGWVFHYGRQDFQNLVEASAEDDPLWYFFLSPVTTTYDYSVGGGFRSGEQYEGYFMILTKSDIDQEYDAQTGERTIDEGKWRQHILPKLQEIAGSFEKEIICSPDLILVYLRIIDAINQFDTNFDGIAVNFKIRKV
ncbi:MAG: hypothetical protein KDD49_03875 [Bacteroidetes bacterium]|nr:hypothetical protein [Bacteroidota bacterium]